MLSYTYQLVTLWKALDTAADKWVIDEAYLLLSETQTFHWFSWEWRFHVNGILLDQIMTLAVKRKKVAEAFF